jgi:hypothetical protein
MDAQVEYQTNYGGTHTSSMKLGMTAAKSRDTKIIVISVDKWRAEAEKIIVGLPLIISGLQRVREFYRQYLQRMTSVELPDAELQRAYDWSRGSSGLVSNPTMGDD